MAEDMDEDDLGWLVGCVTRRDDWFVDGDAGMP